jgi:hypothetical protein
MGTGTRGGKQVVYRYNGVESSEEVEVDHNDEIAVPETGQLMTRKGKTWKVVHVIQQETVAGPRAIPILRIFLADYP